MSSWRWLLREWRGGELGLLATALVVAVAIVSGISGFAERLQSGIEVESRRFLAADRVLQRSKVAPAEWAQRAQSEGLATAHTVNFQSMVFTDEGAQLCSVKAVTDQYPLKGELQISDQPFGDLYVAEGVPKPGTAWLDPRLFPLLGLSPGDSIRIGEKSFIAERAISNEPDRGGSYMSVSPRVMINEADLAATEILQVGSLVQYRYMYAGSEPALLVFGDWLQSRKDYNDRWQSLEDVQPAITSAMARAESFLLLSGSFGVALAGVALALAARRYSERHFDSVAVMKTLGAGGGQITGLYLGNLALLTFVATAFGCLLGFGVQAALMTTLGQLLDFAAPQAGFKPLLTGAATAVICVTAFAAPPVLALRNISPLRVLRREDTGAGLSVSASLLLGLLGLLVLMWWYAKSLIIATAVIGAALGMMLIVSLGVSLLLRQSREVGMNASSALGLAIAALYRRANANAFQIVSFALALMVLLSLFLIRTSLLRDWQLQLPEDAPNHFLTNIRPSEVDSINAFLAESGYESAGLFPMVRSRITHINNVSIKDIDGLFERDSNIDRERSLSTAETLPEDNRLIEGGWWQEGAVNQVSVEHELAEQIGVSVGDSITFLIAGETLDVEVVSLRELDWGSMRPNFYFLLHPKALDGYAGTAITSFYLPKTDKVFLNRLIREFPTVTVIELDAVIEQVQTIVAQVSAAIELVLALVIVCGLLVLIANVRASLDERLHENAILRTLGAGRRLISGSLWIEFAALGLLAGLLAAVGTEAATWYVQTRALDIDWQFHWPVWIMGPVIGAALISVVGVLSCRRVVNTPPLRVLNAI